MALTIPPEYLVTFRISQSKEEKDEQLIRYLKKKNQSLKNIIIFLIITSVILCIMAAVDHYEKQTIRIQNKELLQANQHLKSENTFLKKSLEYEDKRLLKN